MKVCDFECLFWMLMWRTGKMRQEWKQSVQLEGWSIIQMRAIVALIDWWLCGWGKEGELGLAGELDVEMKVKERFGKTTVTHFF